MPLKDLYRHVKDLERQLVSSSSKESGVAEAGPVAGTSGPTVELESIKAEKKQVKREIQAWLEEFEAREGRAAQQE